MLKHSNTAVLCQVFCNQMHQNEGSYYGKKQKSVVLLVWCQPFTCLALHARTHLDQYTTPCLVLNIMESVLPIGAMPQIQLGGLGGSQGTWL